jgi:hypothetical protein
MAKATASSVAAALERATADRRAHPRFTKCFTCREPRWAAFVKEGVALGYGLTVIFHALQHPEKYGLDFPPYPHRQTTLDNHLRLGHVND